jgi:hypothetical protein
VPKGEGVAAGLAANGLADRFPYDGAVLPNEGVPPKEVELYEGVLLKEEVAPYVGVAPNGD